MPSAVPSNAAAALPPARMIDPRGHRFGAGLSALLLLVSFVKPIYLVGRYDMLGFDLTVPPGWQIASGGIAGEAGRFESSTSTLRVLRARGAALSTADSYADIGAAPEKVGLADYKQTRSVTRINGVLVVDDQYSGTYEGRHIVWRQFTAVPGGQGLALLYRVVEPANDQAALDEAAAIAATWHINAEGR